MCSALSSSSSNSYFLILNFSFSLRSPSDVVLYLSVPDVNRAIGVGGHVGFVRDEHDRVA